MKFLLYLTQLVLSYLYSYFGQQKLFTHLQNNNLPICKILNPKYLKACVRYFSSNFYFSPNYSLSKTMKNVFLFHLRSSFCSPDIQIFVFSSSSLLFPVSHCFSGLFKKNLKIYGVINYLDQNLIIHFV